MSITKTLGGERLGTGKKMQVRMHNFERSSHNLSREWKSSMNVGTLVPCFNEVGLPGDSFDIDIETLVKTQPTSGPLFGSFKMQIDMFACPIRLYNGALHNNTLGVGLKMSEIEMPKIKFRGMQGGMAYRFNPSSLNAYLGLRGTKKSNTDFTYNGIRHIAYYDIFKNYYSNKQEKNAYVISTELIPGQAVINKVNFWHEDGSASTWAWNNTKKQYENTNSKLFTWGYCTGFTLYLSQAVKKPVYDIDVETVFPALDPDAQTDYIRLILPTADKITDKDGNYCEISGWGTDIIEFKGNVPYFGIRAYLYKYINKKPYIYLTNCGIESREGVIGSFPAYDISDVDLKPFLLSNIDDMREDILASGKRPAIIDDYSPEPYGINSLIRITPNTEGGPSIYMQNQDKFKQLGLCVKTYLSDIFNNWLDSETITGDNGIAAVTAVDTSSGSFTIDSLILANKVYNMLNRIAVSGGSYDDWQEVVYGETQNFRAESPIYLGGMAREIYFDEIVSTADSSAEGTDVPLGSLAGKGIQSEKRGGKVSFRVNEPSIIMGIVSLTPRIDYSQGNDWFMTIGDLDELHKPNLDGIGFQDLMASNMYYADDLAVGKQPAWINYMTSYNQNYGDFATGGSLEHMVLNRNYNISDADHIKDVTTYIDPRKYNYIFADSSLDAENFWVQIAFNVIGRRKMSAKIMPNL